jgi:hypothetical protein
MLKQVDVTTRRGTSLSFDMFENDSGYQIADVQGLGPVKATLVSSDYANMDGLQYQSASRGARNIKLILDLEPDGVTETYTSLRTRLDSFFMTKTRILLRFTKTSGLYVDIVGIVEDVSVPMFDEDPQVTISIMCFLPDFLDPRTVELDGVTVATSTVTPILYPGTVETGIILTMNVNRSLSGFTIYNTGEDGILQQLDFSAALLSGDVLVINSVRRSKGITLTRSGITSSLLYGKTPQSSWIQFDEGVNNFRVYAPGDPVPYQLDYTVRYGGI